MTPEYSQGVCSDGALILKDGEPMTIDEVIAELSRLTQLCASRRESLDYLLGDEAQLSAEDLAQRRGQE